ncbi:MAG: response regulator transcription factor [Negativicutes bacterium]
MARRILIADDDTNIRELIKIYLLKEGFEVFEAVDGAETIVKAQQCNPDILVLDIMMPVLDGIEVCRQIRRFSKLPIIMLTARADDDDRIIGLETGADDYLTKPFNPRELVARINAVLRRSEERKAEKVSEIVVFPYLNIDHNNYLVKVDGQEINMTNKEFELLWFFTKNTNKVFTRDQLLEKVWGYEYYGDTRTVDTHVKRLRAKLSIRDSFGWDIKTVWGVGYKFEDKN